MSQAVKRVQDVIRDAMEHDTRSRAAIGRDSKVAINQLLAPDANPSIKTLEKLASTLGRVVNVRFLVQPQQTAVDPGTVQNTTDIDDSTETGQEVNSNEG